MEYSRNSPDYRPQQWNGFGVYATFDFRVNFGVEAEFRQTGRTYPYPASTLENPTPLSFSISAYQRNFEIGPRYVRYYGRFHPYGKILYGRGVQNFPEAAAANTNANLAYNMGVVGGGVDVSLLPKINVRADYEYQHWFSFPSVAAGRSLTPKIFSFGAAYHF